MERSRFTSSMSTVHLSVDLKLKPANHCPSSKALRLAGNSVLVSKSINQSSFNSHSTPKSIPKLSKQQTIAYTDWEIFNASQEKKGIKTDKNIQKLRRNIKNPKIYVNSTDINQDQDFFESHLFRAFKNINSD